MASTRVALVALLVAAVLLSGCAGILGGAGAPGDETPTGTEQGDRSTPTATATPAPSESGGGGAPTLSDFAYPDGANATAVNYDRLVDQHTTALNAQGYDYREVQTSTDGSVQVVDRVASDPDDRVQYAHHAARFRGENGTWDNATVSRYWTTDGAYERDVDARGIDYARPEGTRNFTRRHDPEQGYSVGNGDYDGLVDRFGWEARSVTTMAGRPVARYETTPLEGNGSTFSNDSSGTMYVSEAGAILRLELSLRTAGSDAGTDVTYAVRDLGNVTVNEPSWTHRVREQTSETVVTSNSSGDADA